MMQSRVVKLQREDEKMMKKLENERKKAEDVQRIRQSYNEKMNKIREASFEKEAKMGANFD